MNAATSSLNAESVLSVFSDCLFKEGEDTSGHIEAEGIMNTVGFHPERLESHRQEIIDMLAELPDEFQQSKGGGSTFLNACLDRHGNQWADLHQTMEKLVLLGIATKQVEFSFPRNIWPSLPGSMPYFVVKDDSGQPADQGTSEKSAQEHLDWCVERAMEYFEDGDTTNAIASFVSDVRKHDGTAHIAGSDLGGMTLIILQEGAQKGSQAFKEAMEGFAV